MYVPNRFREDDQELALELISERPLATVISITDSNEPFISHLPLMLERGENGSIELLGRLARANPPSKLLLGSPVTAIFHGPNCYITPGWYSQNNVPTWNYAVVHCRGAVELIEDDAGVEDCVRKLSQKMEVTSKNPWEFWVPENLAAPKLAKAIVGFRIKVTEIRSKFKLSQQHPESERSRVVNALRSDRTDEQSQQIAALMARTKSKVQP